MADQEQTRVQELHQKLLQESQHQIDLAIDHIKDTVLPNTPSIAKPDPEVHSVTTIETPADTPDKVNEIRNQVSITQSPLSPEKQSKLMEVVDQKAEQFERELQDIQPGGKEAVGSEVQKFKNRLIAYLRHELEEKRYVLEN